MTDQAVDVILQGLADFMWLLAFSLLLVPVALIRLRRVGTLSAGRPKAWLALRVVHLTGRGVYDAIGTVIGLHAQGGAPAVIRKRHPIRARHACLSIAGIVGQGNLRCPSCRVADSPAAIQSVLVDA